MPDPSMSTARRFDNVPTNRRRKLVLSFYVVAAVCFLGLAFVQKDYETSNAVIVVNPLITNWIWRLSLVCFILLIAIAVLGFWLKPLSYRPAAVGLAFLVFPASCVTSWHFNLAPWTTLADIEGPDCKTYYFMDSRFLQGRTMALMRLERQTLVASHMELLGTTNGDGSRGAGAVILRPEGTPTMMWGELYFTRDDTLLAFRDAFNSRDSLCFMAYDVPNELFIEGKGIRDISPFALLGESTPIHQPDLAGH